MKITGNKVLGKVNTALGVGVFEQKKEGAKVEECYQLDKIFKQVTMSSENDFVLFLIHV